MSETSIYSAALDKDIRPLSAMLWEQNIPHRIVEENGAQVVLLEHENARALALRVCGRFEQLEAQGVKFEVTRAKPSSSIGGSLLAQAFQAPLTAVLILISIAVAAVTSLGENLEVVRWFSFFDIHSVGDGRYIRQGSMAGLHEGQYWRALSPIFIHFGALHIAFNMLWLWELGRRIEILQSVWSLLLLVVLVGVLSNTAQFIAGPSLFGGMSGVLYGLLGFIWIWPKVDPQTQFHLPKGIIGFMLIWLVFCMTDFTEALNLGSVANTAHVSGLVIGCLFAAIGASIKRFSRG